MADNVTADPGAGGVSFRTDEVSAGVHAPYTKLMDGTDGGTAVIPGDATNGLFVQVKASAIPTGAATAAKQDTEITHLATLAGAVAGTEVQVDIVASAAIPVTDNSGSLTVDFSGQKTSDYDTGAGTDTVLMAGIALPASGGAVAGGTSTNPLRTDPTGTTAQPVTDNSGSLTTDTPQLPAALVGGRLDVVVGAALPAGTNNIGDMDILSIAAGDNNIGNVDIVSMPNVTLAAGTNTNEVVGDGAHDAAIAGNPVRMAGRAASADYTAVASGDTADILTDLNGKQIVLPYAIPENFEYGVSAAKTDTAASELLAAAGAGVRHYITQITVINSHATVGTVVEIRDGTVTVMHRGYAAPVGGGYSIPLPVPLRGTANTAINAYNITTGSNTYVSVSGYKAP